MKNALDLSFRLRCPAFDRNDNDIDEWYTYNFKNPQPLTQKHEDGFAKFGLEKYYTTCFNWGKVVNNWDANYTFNNGKKDQKFDNVDDYQRHLGKYFCGSITGKCGMLYQDIDITLHGTYVIECKGYSNTPKAKLFAGVLDPKNENKMVDGTMNSTVFNQVSDMSTDEQNALHTGEHNMDYAGKAFFDNRKYMNSVVLTVPESAFNKDGVRLKSVKIRFGVMTGEYNTDPSQVVAPDAKEWTVFDDFRLQYASTQTSQDLILDEKRDNLNYLYNTTNTYKNTTLHLNKTLTKKKWNSLVLPVSLTKGQLRSTFGANTRLAQLNTLTSTSIEFKSVKLDEMGDDEVALTAYMPYIIFPEKEMDANNTKDYTASLTVDGQTKKVYVPAGHYNIAKVTMVDFSKIDKSNWTTKLYGGDNTIKAYGTFARTFGKFSSYDEATGVYGKVTVEGMEDPIIPGRPRLEHSYFFDKGNMYHSTGRPRGLHGFSCWFEPVSGGTPQNVQLTLDGVTPNGTTGIEDILADYEQPVSRFANGIYNMNGQLVKQGNSTAGLPSGMYIVNGKKCIVR
ncbi:sO34 adhesin [Prevotella sp. CAG:520]|nr:sO34 adhesin [Prevotella sp. CAG:520]